LGDAFGPDFYGFRCATEHPANVSPSGRASADFATLQNILRMVPLRIMRIPIAGYIKLLRLEIGIDRFGVKKHVAS
jgi:hypothetical protein